MDDPLAVLVKIQALLHDLVRDEDHRVERCIERLAALAVAGVPCEIGGPDRTIENVGLLLLGPFGEVCEECPDQARPANACLGRPELRKVVEQGGRFHGIRRDAGRCRCFEKLSKKGTCL